MRITYVGRQVGLGLLLFMGSTTESNAYPVRAYASWALDTGGRMNPCQAGSNCYPGQSRISVSAPQTVTFAGQYTGPTLNLDSGSPSGAIYVTNSGPATVTFTSTLKDATSGVVLATGATTTNYVLGAAPDCATRGLNPSTNAQPLLLTGRSGTQLVEGHAIELSITLTANQPVNLGVCVGQTGSSFTNSGLTITGFIVPNFDSPPTPTCGAKLAHDVGDTISFTVQGRHPTAASGVTLDVINLPAGATMTPSLPVSGNPASSTFYWTPTVAQRGRYPVSFKVSDGGGNDATCNIPINIGWEALPTETILVSPRDFPYKVTFETRCRESVADVCLYRDIVRVCVGGNCFDVWHRENPPCRVCELIDGIRKRP